MSGKIFVVSIGPGDNSLISPAAEAALEEADVFIGYATYLDLISEICPEKPREFSLMRQETERAEAAVQAARSGKKIAVISGGDAGIFGMAGLILETIEADGLSGQIDAEIFPGISALNAAAALLGAPLMTDFAAVSLSNYLIPLEKILKRVSAAAETGFILCLYNPRSSVRTEPWEKTLEILGKVLPAETPVGIVTNAYRKNQKAVITHLSDLCRQEVNMDSIVIIGNETTRIISGKMVTPRGYQLKGTVL